MIKRRKLSEIKKALDSAKKVLDDKTKERGTPENDFREKKAE
jgi:hypothetical protein